MSNLLKDAIADAKAVRESAYAQAKEVLEESFAPQLQKMIAAKLQEMEVNEEEELEEVENLEENSEELEEDFNLDEILAELNEADEAELEEAKEEEEEEESEEEAPAGAEEAPAGAEGEGEEAGEQEEIGEMTVKDLKDLIQQIVDEELAGGDETDKDGEGDMAGDSMSDNFGADVNPPADDQAGMMEEEDSINLEELLAELSEEEDEEELPGAPDEYGGVKGGMVGEGKTWKDRMQKDRGPKPLKSSKKQVSEEIEEAYKVIKHLQSELHEINLLNSRLLYSNKLFMENNSLTESQKIKIIKSFDQVSTPKEAKLVYTTLTEGLATKKSTKKTALKESLSFASKAAGTSTSTGIVEVDPVVARFRQLINYNK
jgi:hypothetical protein